MNIQLYPFFFIKITLIMSHICNIIWGVPSKYQLENTAPSGRVFVNVIIPIMYLFNIDSMRKQT